MLAIQIEKRYTKREIFTLYCNQMYFGHGVYGVEAASRLYFGKSAKDLTLAEAALIAGILQGNVRQSPYVNMEAAVRRRNYALTRMADVGFISAEEADGAKKNADHRQTPTRRHRRPRPRTSSKKSARSWRSATAQSSSTRTACRSRPRSTCACRRLPPSRSTPGCAGSTSGAGFRKPRRNVVAGRARAVETFAHPRWERAMAAGEIVPAMVTAMDRTAITRRAGKLRVTIDRERLRLDRQDQPRRSSSPPAISIEIAAGDRHRHRHCRDRHASSSRRRSKARSWPSTTTPARSARCRAATASSAASSIAPPRPTGRSARHSSRSSTPQRSIAATRRSRC